MASSRKGNRKREEKCLEGKNDHLLDKHGFYAQKQDISALLEKLNGFIKALKRKNTSMQGLGKGRKKLIVLFETRALQMEEKPKGKYTISLLSHLISLTPSTQDVETWEIPSTLSHLAHYFNLSKDKTLMPKLVNITINEESSDIEKLMDTLAALTESLGNNRQNQDQHKEEETKEMRF